jgi:hypothetical protein
VISITLFILNLKIYCVLYLIFYIYVAVIVLKIRYNLHNLEEKPYIMYESILDILLELFDNPTSADEGVSVLEDLEPEVDPEEESTDPEAKPEGPEVDPEGDPDDPDKDDKKRKRNNSDDSDDSEEDSNEPKKSKVDKGKGRADPDDISDDDNVNYGYREDKKPNDEQSFYIDSDDSDDYLGESLDRRVELQKKLEDASPEEKAQILSEMDSLTQMINDLLDDDDDDE